MTHRRRALGRADDMPAGTIYHDEGMGTVDQVDCSSTRASVVRSQVS
jgi:hypothetical protein